MNVLYYCFCLSLLRIIYSTSIPSDQWVAVVDLFNSANLTLPSSDTPCEDFDNTTLDCDTDGNVISFVHSITSDKLPTSIQNLIFLESLDLSWSKLWYYNNSEIDGRNFRALKRFTLKNTWANQSEFPSYILQFPNIEVIDLTNCSFVGSLPVSLFNLSNLREIYLGRTNISGPLPVSVQPSLRSITISWTRVSGPLPSWKDSNLEVIQLHGNSLIGPLPDFPLSLTFLDIGQNLLTGTLPSDVGLLRNLSWIELTTNSFIGKLPDPFPNSVTYLSLSSNDLTGDIPSSIFQLPQINSILLDDNQLTGTLPKNYSKYLSLISLRGNRVSGPLPAQLLNLPALRNLNLTENQLSGELPIYTSNILTVLGLGSNLFTGTVPTCYFDQRLSILDLGNNSLSSLNTSGRISRFQQLFLEDNQFTGPIPLELFTNPSLLIFRVDNNRFTEFPSATPPYQNRTRLLNYFNFANNNITGRIPSWLISSSLVELDGPHNQLTGRFPSCENGTKLKYVDLSYNNLTGFPIDCLTIPSTWRSLDFSRNQIDFYVSNKTNISWVGPTNLRTLNLNFNKIKKLPQLSNLTLLQLLLVANNSLTSLPDLSSSNLSQLTHIDASNNQLFGNLTPTFPSNLVNLLLSGNQFTSIVPEFSSQHIITLDLTSNNISQSFYDIYRSFTTYLNNGNTSISQLRLRSNKIYGSFSTWISYHYDSASKNSYLQFPTSLNEIDLANNLLTHMEFPELKLRPYLSKVILSNNQITDILTDDMCGYPLLSIELDHNQITSSLPDQIEADYDSLTVVSAQHVECPIFRCKDVDRSVIGLDLNYQNYSYCRCVEGYYKNNGTCVPCLLHAICPGGEILRANLSSFIFANQGYYPDPLENPTQMLECRYGAVVPLSTENPCNRDANLNGLVRFSCAPGSSGFLCSQCLDGYFSKNGLCKKCSERFDYQFFVVVSVFLLFGSTVFFAVLPPSTATLGQIGTTFGLGNILLSFHQTSTIIISKFDLGGFSSNVLSFFGTFSATAILSGMGLECGPSSFRDFYNQFRTVVLFPVFYIVLLFIVFMCKMIYFKHRRPHVKSEIIFFNFLRSTFQFLNVIYFPLVGYIMNVYQCSDHGEVGSYLSDRPSIKCDYISSSVKLACLLFYPVGIWLFFGMMSSYLFMNPKKRTESFWFQSFGFFFKDYREDCLLTGFGFMCLRFTLSSFVALIPSNRNYYPILITFILLLKILFLLNWNPWSRPLWNRAQFISESTSLLIFWNAYGHNPLLFDQTTKAPDIWYVLLNIMCISCILIIYISEMRTIRGRSIFMRTGNKGRNRNYGPQNLQPVVIHNGSTPIKDIQPLMNTNSMTPLTNSVSMAPLNITGSIMTPIHTSSSVPILPNESGHNITQNISITPDSQDENLLKPFHNHPDKASPSSIRSSESGSKFFYDHHNNSPPNQVPSNHDQRKNSRDIEDEKIGVTLIHGAPKGLFEQNV